VKYDLLKKGKTKITLSQNGRHKEASPEEENAAQEFFAETLLLGHCHCCRLQWWDEGFRRELAWTSATSTGKKTFANQE